MRAGDLLGTGTISGPTGKKNLRDLFFSFCILRRVVGEYAGASWRVHRHTHTHTHIHTHTSIYLLFVISLDNSLGSMLEHSWRGSRDVPLGTSGLVRRFLQVHGF